MDGPVLELAALSATRTIYVRDTVFERSCNYPTIESHPHRFSACITDSDAGLTSKQSFTAVFDRQNDPAN